MNNEDEQQFSETCAGMAEAFAEMVLSGELSRLPTMGELERLKRKLRETMEAGKWQDCAQQLVALLREVAPDVRTTLQWP